MQEMYKNRLFRYLISFGLVISSWQVFAASVVLDKQVRAGELILFPDVSNKNVYRYVPDKVRLATDKDGNPKFSFLRYIKNVRSGATEAEKREGEAGGIVHAVVSLGVTKDQIRDARRELTRINPKAKLEGPVLFDSGKFGLVSSFTDKKGGLTTQVVGLGNAPLLDGEKAAVSLQLTKKGAEILWESFKTPTADLSFSFEMEMSGYQSPKKAVIEANFDQIYDHKGFAAGVATPYLAAEIKGAFDDLQKKGAIKLTQVGEDAKMEALITTAYNKITDMMFKPSGGTGTPSLASLTGAGGRSGPSLLDKATSMLDKRRQEARKENERIRREQRQADQAARAERQRQQATARARPTTPSTEQATDDEETPPRYSETRPAASREPNQQELQESQRRDADSGGEGQQQQVSTPSFAAVASFEMKKVRQRGNYKIDLNKYTADKINLRFDQNIGDLRSFMNNSSFFRTANLDDPVYKQREIVAFIDGFNASDFGKFINFATVQLNKEHAKGAKTIDEVRVDRNNFNKEGNNFKLLYGWKNDKDREKWLQYKYRVKWSFFGGYEVEEPWKPSVEAALNLAPPYQRRKVLLDADSGALKAAGVRAVTVKLYYTLGNKIRTEKRTLNIRRDQASDEIVYLAPKDIDDDYKYDITYQLKGNKVKQLKGLKGVSSTLFIDEPPSGT